ncbi:Alpha/Beta hydrolase protein [Trametes elegans]|nr:Alpha/Beta hydrolase protein [Trametes elegans]
MAYNHLAQSDPELAPLLATLASVQDNAPSTKETFAQAREHVDSVMVASARAAYASRTPPKHAVNSADHQIAVDDGQVHIQARSYWPASATNGDPTLPLLVWFHGGGLIFGNIEMDDDLLRILSVDLQLVAVNVEYRLTPEHPWPIPLHDAYAAVKWAATNATTLHADTSKGFLLGGVSGGCLFLPAIAHRALSDPFFAQHGKITGQVLQIPSIVHPDAVPDEYQANFTSLEQNTHAPLLTAKQVREALPLHGAGPPNPEYSVLMRPLEALSGLAPAYIQVCGLDPVRDGGLLYAAHLRAAGVPARVDTYQGAPHGFHVALPETRAARKFDGDVEEGIRWLLSRPESESV